MQFTKLQIEEMEQRFRISFINSLAGFRQAVLVGTKSEKGKSNLAIFNSLIHLGANPALFGLISRPDAVPRDTLQNILETKQYTLNYVHYSDVKKAHQSSARYLVPEFEAVGFGEEYHTTTSHAPFVANAQVKIAMKLEEKIDIKINGTVMIIGSIQHVLLSESLISKDGFVDLTAAGVLVSCGLDAYFKTESVGRYSYAKPGNWTEKIQEKHA